MPDPIIRPATDHRLNVLLVASVVTAFVVVVGSILAVPTILDSSRTTSAIAEAGEIQGCRALFRVDVDDATARLTVANARLDERTTRGLEVLATEGREGLDRFVVEIPVYRETVETAAVSLDAALGLFRAKLALSREDPARFLDECARL